MDPALAAAGPDSSVATKCDDYARRSVSHSTIIPDIQSNDAEPVLREELERVKAEHYSTCGIRNKDQHGWRRIVRNFTRS